MENENLEENKPIQSNENEPSLFDLDDLKNEEKNND